jgi:hypothetical protein
MTTYEPLKVCAKDEEDLDIIIALLQDSLIPVVSVAFDQENKTLTILANRFCWEIPEEEDNNDESTYYRVHSGLLFKNVEAVHEKNIHTNEKARIISLLIGNIEKKLDAYHLYLHFSDDACMRLTLSDIDCVLADIDEPWSTHSIPMHDVEIDEQALSQR